MEKEEEHDSKKALAELWRSCRSLSDTDRASYLTILYS